VAVPLAVIGLVCVLFLKEVPLGHKSGLDERLERELAAGLPDLTDAIEQEHEDDVPAAEGSVLAGTGDGPGRGGSATR